MPFRLPQGPTTARPLSVGIMARRDSGLADMRAQILCVVIGLIGTIHAAAAQDKFGVVLMHGKQSAPEQHGPLASAIAIAGFPVELPEMCWSDRRIYDRDYLACLDDIAPALGRLRARGAASVVIAGHSLGANAALAYGARNDVKGIVALAPGHLPEVLATRPPIAADLDRSPQADCRRTRQRACTLRGLQRLARDHGDGDARGLSKLLRLGFARRDAGAMRRA